MKYLISIIFFSVLIYGSSAFAYSNKYQVNGQDSTSQKEFIDENQNGIDDREENGMDLIANIIKMYRNGDSHVELLTASVRNISHHLYALKLGSDIITTPFEILKEWWLLPMFMYRMMHSCYYRNIQYL
jgi:hypothetical protein